MRVKLIACERVINLTGLLSGGVSRGIKMAVSKATDRTAVRSDITHSPTEYSCFYIRKKEDIMSTTRTTPTSVLTPRLIFRVHSKLLQTVTLKQLVNTTDLETPILFTALRICFVGGMSK